MADYLISRRQAQRYLYHYHGFSRGNGEPRQAILNTFDRLRAIQYDPIDIVGRNADLVLQSRVKHYRPALLTELLYDDRHLIDDWDKMMCIYLASDWQKLRRVQLRRAAGYRSMYEYRGQLAVFDVLDDVYRHVEAHGLTRSKDIAGGGTNKGRWGHGRLSGAADC